MTTLSLTTSTQIASVALIEGDQVLAEISRDDPRDHAEKLFALIDLALSTSGRQRESISLVACDIGPGSFTGVRIAVASAKGIAVGLDVPLIGIVSLEAMASHAKYLWNSRSNDRQSPPPEEREQPLVAAAIDAKKDELYVAIYDEDRLLLEPSHIARASVPDRIRAIVAEHGGRRPVVSVADSQAFVDFAAGADLALVAPPTAGWVGRLANLRRRAEPSPSAFDPAEVVPQYVRAPDAIPSVAGTRAAFGMLPPR